MISQNEILFDKYKILTEIGHGGMSTVWLARDKNLNKTWAVKEISKNSQEFENGKRVLSEVEIMKNLDHTSLPRIVEVFEEKDYLYIIMDYIEGETLSKVLKLYGKQDQNMVVNWMLEICDVLNYLHHQDPPIIYRDMKPANIMLKPEGTVKVIDFGIARRYKESQEDTTYLGTPSYASPEHFTGKTTVRSDIFTVGTTMYHLLTGKNPKETGMRPIRELDPSLSSGLEKIIIKATETNPQDRYKNMDEMIHALLNYKKLEDEYIDSYKNKIKKFIIILAAGTIMLLLGCALLVGQTIKDNNKYEALVNNQTPDSLTRINYLREAIKLKPEKTEAYIKIIEEYSKDGIFEEAEASDFLSIFNSNKEKIKKNKENYSELNFTIGSAVLTYYSSKKDHSTRNRIIMAEEFFKNSDKEIAQNYVWMANYYQNYVIGNSGIAAKEPSEKEYNTLVKEINKIINNLDVYKGEKKQLELVTYNLILDIIDEQRDALSHTELKESDLIKTVNELKNRAQKVNTTLDVGKKKKAEVIKNATELNSKIQISYSNARKEKEGGNR